MNFVIDNEFNLHLVVGDDGRIFEKEAYKGETFHGTLMDHKGKGIKGAIVYTSDPFDYVKSDRNGRFLIDNVLATDTIHVRHDGYIHDIAMDGSKGMYIVIGRNSGRKAKEELVYTGTGVIDSRYYNGPMTTRTSKELEAMGTANLALAMNGMRGVRVYYPKDANGDPAVSVRGGGKPLWILDSVQMEEMPDITVMEVEKVQVLHNGAMFGIRGYGGVIVVTTKGSNF